MVRLSLLVFAIHTGVQFPLVLIAVWTWHLTLTPGTLGVLYGITMPVYALWWRVLEALVVPLRRHITDPAKEEGGSDHV
jgi:Na+-transporting NADH:ubiquinone oxidoreductase subunit NqrB